MFNIKEDNCVTFHRDIDGYPTSVTIIESGFPKKWIVVSEDPVDLNMLLITDDDFRKLMNKFDPQTAASVEKMIDRRHQNLPIIEC